MARPELGGFIDWMKAEGAWDDTLFVLTADHGEEFYEHGGWWHGITLYDEQIHVPLISAPERSRGPRVPWQCQDVSPTLVDFGVASSRRSGRGRPCSTPTPAPSTSCTRRRRPRLRKERTARRTERPTTRGGRRPG